jgi:fluoroquinolone transport system ATP-binding protein
MDEMTIRVRDLTFTYPGREHPAIQKMTFEVARGEVFGFLGPSGAGKTTTQRVLIGLLDGWTGDVEVLGRDRRRWGTALYDRIGVAFELPVGYPRLTGREDLTHFANLHAGAHRDVGDLLDSVGLAQVADTQVGSYSKGMRVRLNLARALLHEPDVLFADEPTAGLDPVNTGMVREHILDQKERGRTVVVTTHDMDTATAVCDRVAFIVDGRIVACDSPRAFRLAHARPEVRVEYRTVDGVTAARFPLGQAPPELVALLSSDRVETVHTSEATLGEVFAEVTGRRL